LRVIENAYPNGDVYYLVGELESDWEKAEFRRFAGIASTLAKMGCRVIMNPTAHQSDVEEELEAA